MLWEEYIMEKRQRIHNLPFQSHRPWSSSTGIWLFLFGSTNFLTSFRLTSIIYPILPLPICIKTIGSYCEIFRALKSFKEIKSKHLPVYFVVIFPSRFFAKHKSRSKMTNNDLLCTSLENFTSVLTTLRSSNDKIVVL